MTVTAKTPLSVTSEVSMEATPEYSPPRRSVNLSDADIERLRALLADHPCKFAITHEEMDDLKRLSRFIKDVEAKVVGGIAWFFIALIAGMLALLYNHGYLLKGK